MKARIVERKWVQEWFDERQCNHMPSIILGYDGTLLAEWTGGMLNSNGDPMGRDTTIWLSRLEPGAKQWSEPEGIGTDMRYCCKDGVWYKNRHGHIYVLFAKFLDTETNPSKWCSERDVLYARKSVDGGLTWLPTYRTNIPPIGWPSNDGILLPNGEIVLAISSIEKPDNYLGCVRILRSKDDGETWEVGPLLETDDGTKIREPAIALRPNGDIQMFTRTCPADLHWGGPGIERVIYSFKSRSTDGGHTWSKPEPSAITNNESKIDLISWPDGSLLMAYDFTTNLDWHERSPLWLAASQDEGQTWANLIEIAPGPGVKAQPTMCQGKDGLLHIVYMHRHTAVEHVVVELT